MNIFAYGQETQDLIKQIQTYSQRPGNYVFRLLKQLKSLNKNNDYTINGYINYVYAFVYLHNEKHDLFVKYLKEALYYLLRSDEKEYTARAYNLFAIEAQKNGHFDIAYDYYQMALSFVSNDKKSIIYGMLIGNIGDLYAKMGDFKNAYDYSKRSYSIIMKKQDDEENMKNKLIIMVNLSIYDISLNKLKRAKETLKNLQDIGEEGLEKIGGDAVLWSDLFFMRYAIATKDIKALYKYGKIVKQKIISSVFFNEFIQETYDLCLALIQIKEWDILGDLLESIEKNKDINNYASILFNNLRIEYYKNTNNHKKLIDSYKKLNEYTITRVKNQNKAYYESIELMSLFEELYNEEIKIEKENVLLQKDAETDALTGIPNRYALNRILEKDFNNALNNGTQIGVGMADIDSFKFFNDTYGHKRGDECLIMVAKELSTLAKEQNIFVARYGGDEFIFIYNNLDHQEIRKFQKKIYDTCSVSITHAFFVAYPDENSRIWDFIAEADDRLYKKKRMNRK